MLRTNTLCTPPSLPPSHTSALMDMSRELFWKFPKQPSMTSVPGRTTPQDRVSQMTLNTRYTPYHPHPGQHTYICHVLLVSFAFKLTDDPPGRTRPLERLNHKEHGTNTRLLKRKWRFPCQEGQKGWTYALNINQIRHVIWDTRCRQEGQFKHVFTEQLNHTYTKRGQADTRCDFEARCIFQPRQAMHWMTCFKWISL